MDKRRIAVALAIGAAGLLFFVRVHPHGQSPALVIGDQVAAQTPSTESILIKLLPNLDDSDIDHWHRYELTVPPSSTPMDMHVAFLVDGKGTDLIDERPSAWPQPLSFKYRLDSDDDGRVKDVLEAQGLPVKKNLVTYRFAAGTGGGWVGYNKTIQFKNGPYGVQSNLGILWSPDHEVLKGAVGEKIILENRLLADTNFKGDFDKASDWSQPGYAPKTPSGMVHHLVVYVMFKPHQGPPVKFYHSYGREI